LVADWWQWQLGNCLTRSDAGNGATFYIKKPGRVNQVHDSKQTLDYWFRLCDAHASIFRIANVPLPEALQETD